MEEKCVGCGREINKESRYDVTCDGVLTWDTDPFQYEINDDNTEYYMCEGARYDSAMEI